MAKKFLSERVAECKAAVELFPTIIVPGVPTSKQSTKGQSTGGQSSSEMFYEAWMGWAANDVEGQEARKRFRETVAWFSRDVANTSAWNQLHALGQLLETQHKINTAIVYIMRDLEAMIP